MRMKKLQLFFTNRPEILAAYLFGSRTKGTATRKSDIDIALLIDEKKMKPKAGMEIDYSMLIEEHTGLKNVDVKILNLSPLYFQYEVLKNSTLIFCRDEIRRIRYEAHLTVDYLDYKPYLDYFDRRMHEHIKEGTYGPGLSVRK